MREVDEKPKQQFSRVFANQKFHIATKTESYHFCLCGIAYSREARATPIPEYVGDECMSCRHASSKKRTLWTGEWVVEVRIRRARQA